MEQRIPRGKVPRRVLACSALLVTAFTLSSCIVATQTFDGAADPAPLTEAVLTRAAADNLGYNDTYTFTRDAGTLTIAAPATNTGGNRREVYWPADGAAASKEMSCQTWEDSLATVDQQGIALRIAPTADGLGTRAVTITKNILYGFYWVFNVHVWDTTTSPITPFKLITQFNFGNIVTANGALVPAPWHVCARVVGSTFQAMVWTGTDPQPDWTDPDHVQTTTLPDGWDYPGYAGWYIGHLHAGDVNVFSDLATWSLAGTLDTTTTLAPTTTVAPTTTLVTATSAP